MMVVPPLASSYAVPDFCSDSTIALASLLERLLNSAEYDGFAPPGAKKYPPMARARIAKTVTAFCPGVKDLNVSPTLRTGAGRRSVISGLHPHDLLEGLHGLVPDRHGELESEGGLGGRHGVLRRVLQRAVGHLDGQIGSGGLGGLHALQSLGQHAGEVGVDAAGGRGTGGA